MMTIEPQVSGTVVSISADITDFAKEGQILVRLDDTDASIALEKAKVEMAQAVHQVKSHLDKTAGGGSNVALREKEVERAQSDYDRRKFLYEQKAVTDEVFEHARLSLRSAQDALELARHQLREMEELAGNGVVEKHTTVRMAKEKLRDAYFALKRTVVVAPVSGHVAKRSVQVGERVSPGKPLMALIPLEKVWVEANFKENQLADVRINQPAVLESDMYGKETVFHGKVAGIGAGTGSVFSVIPPQNATGNWIKVIQRVPVKITLDTAEIIKKPLIIGLSMKVMVDTRDKSGPVITAAASERELYRTDVYGKEKDGAEELIQKVIRESMGKSVPGNK
jgi:membrane fusion protein (multidrug efflux system)